MSTYFRSLVLILGCLLTLIAPALAEGQATGKRQHSPIRFEAYYNTSINLDSTEVTIGDILGPDGLFLVLLPEDPTKWNWRFLEDLVVSREAASFRDITIIAVYPTTKYTKYAQEDLDHLGEYMQVSQIDEPTRFFLPEVGDEVLVAFFQGDGRYRGGFKTVDGLSAEIDIID